MKTSSNETRFSVGTIFHPPFLGLLNQHLTSITEAQKQYPKQVRVTLLFSYVTDDKQVKRARSIIEKHDSLDIELLVVHERLTCGGARNYLQAHMPTRWKIFLDVDVAMAPAYFTVLNPHIDSIEQNQPQIKAIGGGIGSWGETRIGTYEYLMDLYAYYGKSKGSGINRDTYNFKKLIVRNGQTNENIARYSGTMLTYLQGFNHVIHEDVFKDGGYDDNFFGAEDREMAGKIIAVGYKIILIPECMVYHYYNFSLNDILRRKYGHGYYSAMFRKKYLATKQYASGVKMYTLYTLSVLFPPRTFRSPYGYWYYFIGYVGFTAGTVMYHIQARAQGWKIFRFNYSAYSFTKKNEEEQE